jgi:hypothetical protein
MFRKVEFLGPYRVQNIFGHLETYVSILPFFKILQGRKRLFLQANKQKRYEKISCSFSSGSSLDGIGMLNVYMPYVL